VHERIGLSVIALNEAETLHRIEELDRAGRLLAGELPLGAACAAAGAATRSTAEAAFTRLARSAFLDRHRLAINLEIGRRDPAAAIDKGELQRLAVSQTGQACLLNRRDVNEHILTAIIANDEAEALLAVEEFDDAFAFADHLGRHATTATAAAAETTAAAAAVATAAAAAAEAITATATATEAISTAPVTAAAATAEAIAAAEAAATACIATVTLVTEAVALVPAAARTALTSIKTHALQFFPNLAPCVESMVCRARAQHPSSAQNTDAPEQ
jgi:hypothetical protein